MSVTNIHDYKNNKNAHAIANTIRERHVVEEEFNDLLDNATTLKELEHIKRIQPKYILSRFRLKRKEEELRGVYDEEKILRAFMSFGIDVFVRIHIKKQLIEMNQKKVFNIEDYKDE